MMEHGGRLDAAIARFGGRREDWLDLSTGISPVSYPVPFIDQVIWHRLPEAGAMDRLHEAARQYYQVQQETDIVAGAGSQNFIQILPALFPPSEVGIISPTYNEHAHCWAAAGHRVNVVESLQSIGDVKHLVLVNPNNPDGTIYTHDDIVCCASELAKRDGYLIVDEAFCDFKPELSIIQRLPENCIVLRSVGKFFGLAGIRLGFAICSSEIAERLRSKLGPWPVSGPAIETGIRALTDEEWINGARDTQAKLAREIENTLKRAGLEVVANAGLFLLAKNAHASNIFDQLGEHHILVRAFQQHPEWLRFGLCKDGEELARLQIGLQLTLKPNA